MSGLEDIVKVLLGLAIAYVAIKILLAIMGFLNILTGVGDYISSIPYLNMIILFIFAIGAGYLILK